MRMFLFLGLTALAAPVAAQHSGHDSARTAAASERPAHASGEDSHCGIDHFDLVRQDGRWRVLNLTWTQQTQGCPGR